MTRLIKAALAVAIVVTTVVACGQDVAVKTDAAPTQAATTTTSASTTIPTTTTTVDPAAVDAFLKAWADATTTTEAPTTTKAPLPPPTTRRSTPTTTPSAPSVSGGTGGNVGGFLACVRQHESRGNYGAVNPSSGAGGAYQFMPSTWRAMGGSGLPQYASPGEQDAMAQRLYAKAGASPWAGSGC